jgi:hypothetical protein
MPNQQDHARGTVSAGHSIVVKWTAHVLTWRSLNHDYSTWNSPFYGKRVAEANVSQSRHIPNRGFPSILLARFPHLRSLPDTQGHACVGGWLRPYQSSGGSLTRTCSITTAFIVHPVMLLAE